MEVMITKKVGVNVKTVSIHAKIKDCGVYTLLDEQGQEVYSHDGYVPGFFPGEHYGDYLMLDIDIETGQIKNWKAPTPDYIQSFCGGEE